MIDNPGMKWRATTRGAILILRKRNAKLRTWSGFWSTPFYSWLRRRVLHKRDAYEVYVAECDKLMMRYDRIVRRYGN